MNYEYLTEIVSLEDEAFPTEPSYVVLQTRPLNLSNTQTKSIECLISRADVANKDNDYSVQIIAGSNDLRTWRVVSYIQKGGDFSNMTSKHPVGNYKYFILLLAGEREGFELTTVDVEFKTLFDSKLR